MAAMIRARVVALKLKGSKEMSMVNMCCCDRNVCMLGKIRAMMIDGFAVLQAMEKNLGLSR